MTNPAHGMLVVCGRQCQTSTDKNPAWSCNSPWCQVHGISCERFPRPWQTVGPLSGPSRVTDSSLAFLKRWGPLPEFTLSLVRLHRHVWRVAEANLHNPRAAYTPVSRLVLRLTLDLSGHTWLVALPHSPKDHYHDDNVGTQSAGTGRTWFLSRELERSRQHSIMTVRRNGEKLLPSTGTIG